MFGSHVRYGLRRSLLTMSNERLKSSTNEEIVVYILPRPSLQYALCTFPNERCVSRPLSIPAPRHSKSNIALLSMYLESRPLPQK